MNSKEPRDIRDLKPDELRLRLAEVGRNSIEDSGIFRDYTGKARELQMLERMHLCVLQLEKERAGEEYTVETFTPNLDRDIIEPVEIAAKEIVEQFGVDAASFCLQEMTKSSSEVPDFLKEYVESELKDFGKIVPHWAPPIAQDAAQALEVIARLRKAIEAKQINDVAYAASQLGYLFCKLRVRPFEKATLDGRRLKETRRKGGANTAATTQEEKRLIIDARDARAKRSKCSKKKAAEAVAAQLRTGTLPGIDRPVDYTWKYVADLRVKR
ncbi:hypothetical protein [Botrimarina mediterranea]|uniref:Uncharacterized protein n=1 Tax=Botrimarina mediterranea TaxID=2528022 RepID=A0A518K918_9BACT|nr:hypothetical protein [Botrimarina mediterranea]QDV74289.1 hypothetical protein Spa11_24900 [Botrimarina mediterranea]